MIVMTLEIRQEFVWHLTAIAFILRDMALGRLYFGFGRSKGFGRCRLVLEKAALEAARHHCLWETVPSVSRGDWLKEMAAKARQDATPLWFLEKGSTIGNLLRTGMEKWAPLLSPRLPEVHHG